MSYGTRQKRTCEKFENAVLLNELEKECCTILLFVVVLMVLAEVELMAITAVWGKNEG